MRPISGRLIKKHIAATKKRTRFRVRFLDSILGPFLHTAARVFEHRPHDAHGLDSTAAARKLGPRRGPEASEEIEFILLFE